MKVNLGCGADIRTGYLNLESTGTPVPENLPEGAEVIRTDLGTLPDIGDNTVTHMVAGYTLNRFPMGIIPTVLTNWIKKLASGGDIYFENTDSQAIGQIMLFEQAGPAEINQVLFGREAPFRCTFTVGWLEQAIKNLGLNLVEKGLAGPSHYLRAVKP